MARNQVGRMMTMSMEFIKYILTLFVIMKILEERQQLFLIPPQDGLDLGGLLRVGNEYLYQGWHRYARKRG